jgi:hypothetical protein
MAELTHCPGRPDYDTGTRDNENVIVLPESCSSSHQAYSRRTPQDEQTLLPWVDPHKLKKISAIWYKDGRRVVTGDLHEKQDLIKRHHDPPVYGHPGISKTTQIVERGYWWPHMKNDILDYVKGCAECQRHKVNNRPTKAPLQPIYPRAEAMPFETIALDFITKLPVSQGYDSILTITDHDCSKAAIFIPCNEEINAEGTAALYLEKVFVHFGLPTKVISDRDPRFASKFTRELCKVLGISQNISTAYHPRTDGQSERTNQWVETFLRFVTNYKQDDWAAYLPMAQFAHNNWPSDTTRKSPFFLLMGYNPRADWNHATTPLPQVTLRLEQLKEARDQARNLMIKAQKSWVKHKDTPKYKEGDLVWLEGKNLRLNQPTPKFAPRRHGPFKVTQVMSAVNYRLELPTQWSIHPVFHTDLLTPYRETITHGANYQRPPPDLVDNEEEYEVEKVLDSRLFGRRKRLQYLVKWKGYPDSDNMWVDKDDVFADDKVRSFKGTEPRRQNTFKEENPAEIPPAYDYQEEFARVLAEGLGLTQAEVTEGLDLRRGGPQGGQNRGGRPWPVPDAHHPANSQQVQGCRSARRPASPTPLGFEHNRGPAYIPFRTQENGRETPVRYIRAHLDAPNPFVEGRLSLDGPTYHSKIHAAAVHDIDVPPPPITADILRLLHTDYRGHDRVDEALGEISDRSLVAEVNRCRCLKRKRRGFQDSIARFKDQMFTTDVEWHMCISRLEGARAMVRIQGEMQRNVQVFRLSPWSLECGRLP